MVKELLVGFPREAGWKLLEKMDEAGLEITVAYWRYVEEDEEWRFVVATPKVGTQGPLYIIRVIQDLLAAMPDEERDDLSIREIAVVNPHLREIENLRARYGSVNEASQRNIKRPHISRSEPFIYRLT